MEYIARYHVRRYSFTRLDANVSPDVLTRTTLCAIALADCLPVCILAIEVSLETLGWKCLHIGKGSFHSIACYFERKNDNDIEVHAPQMTTPHRTRLSMSVNDNSSRCPLGLPCSPDWPSPGQVVSFCDPT